VVEKSLIVPRRQSSAVVAWEGGRHKLLKQAQALKLMMKIMALWLQGSVRGMVMNWKSNLQVPSPPSHDTPPPLVGLPG
jgi:hypothetical protein